MMSIPQRFGSFSTSLPYDEARSFIEPASGEYGPLSVVIAEDQELGLRDEGSFMPNTGGVREGDQILMAGHLGVMGYEVEVPVVAAFDFRPNHGAVAALRGWFGRPQPPVRITFSPGQHQEVEVEERIS